MAATTTDTANKVTVGARYLGTYGSGILTAMVAVGSLTPDQQTTILASFHTMFQATHDFVGALANIWYILFPIIALWLGKMGVNSSGFGVMMDKIFAAAKAGNVDAKVAIVNAASSKDIGSAGVVNPEMAANPATTNTVVARSSDLPPAKAA
jgi:hypothetical protein